MAFSTKGGIECSIEYSSEYSIGCSLAYSTGIETRRRFAISDRRSAEQLIADSCCNFLRFPSLALLFSSHLSSARSLYSFLFYPPRDNCDVNFFQIKKTRKGRQGKKATKGKKSKEEEQKRRRK